MVSFAKFVTLQEAEAMGADVVAQAHATADASDGEPCFQRALRPATFLSLIARL